MTKVIISIFFATVLAVAAWWVVNTLAPPEPIGKILRVLIVVVFVLWLLVTLGMHQGNFRIGSVSLPEFA